MRKRNMICIEAQDRGRRNVPDAHRRRWQAECHDPVKAAKSHNGYLVRVKRSFTDVVCDPRDGHGG
jgi:hypothetical protein